MLLAVGLAPWLNRLPAVLSCKLSVLCWYHILFSRTPRAVWLSESGTEVRMNEFGFELWLWLGFFMPGFDIHYVRQRLSQLFIAGSYCCFFHLDYKELCGFENLLFDLW